MRNNQLVSGNYTVDFDSIAKDKFLQDLLDKCLDYKIFTQEEVDYINFGISKVLRQHLIYFTKDSSSSINVDIAENLLESVYFSISMSLKKTTDMAEIIDRLRLDSVKSIFKDGQKEIKKRFIKAKTSLEYLKNNRLNIDNYSYIDTIEYGLDLFFKKYNYLFKAHEVPGDIDYQISNNVFEYEGIEQIEKYITNLNYENAFCKNFNIEDIKSLLYSYSNDSEQLLLNVFDIVLLNSLGAYIAGKDIKNLDISYYEKEIIEDKIQKNLQEIVKGYLLEVIDKFQIEDTKFVQYIMQSLQKIKVKLEAEIDKKLVKEAFITFKEKSKKALEYKMALPLADNEFREIFDEILYIEKPEDKIKLIREKIKNINDLTEILSSDFFMEDEYILFFKELDYFSIALIIACFPSIETGIFNDEVWQEEFKRYFMSFPEDIKMKIKEIAKQIKL